jgi:hypothetical protein
MTAPKSFIDIRLSCSRTESPKHQIVSLHQKSIPQSHQPKAENAPIDLSRTTTKIKPPVGISSKAYIDGIFTSSSGPHVATAVLGESLKTGSGSASSNNGVDKKSSREKSNVDEIDQLINNIKLNHVNTRKKKMAPVFVPRNKAPPIRPSLSEQLSNIGDAAQALTNTIRKSHGLNDSSSNRDMCLLRIPAKSFVVGSLSCKYPSPISFMQTGALTVSITPMKTSKLP